MTVFLAMAESNPAGTMFGPKFVHFSNEAKT